MAANIKKFELTAYERACTYETFLGEYITMAISFLESSDGDGLDHEIVLKSLKILQKRHPFFRAHLDVKRKEDKIFLVIDEEKDEAKNIELEFVDLTSQESSNRATLLEIAANFNSKLILPNENCLLWRAQLISYKENSKIKHMFNLCVSMAITDGLNITTLSIEFANILNALLSKKECKEMTEILEPCESMHHYLDKYKLFKEEHKITIESVNKEPRGEFKPDKKFRSDERGYKLDLFKIDKNMSQKMIDLSKSFGVKLTAYFYTTMFYAMHKLYVENGLDFPKNLALEVPVNCRMRYEPKLSFSQGRFHVLFACISTDEHFSGEFKDFQQDCKYFQNLVGKYASFETGAVFSYSHNSDVLDEFNQVFVENDSVDEILKILEDENNSLLSLSNLGAFVNNSVEVFPGKVEIKELYCSDGLQAYPNMGAVVQVHLFYWKGELMVQFGANKAYFSSLYCKRYVELLKETISQTIGSY